MFHRCCCVHMPKKMSRTKASCLWIRRSSLWEPLWTSQRGMSSGYAYNFPLYCKYLKFFKSLEFFIHQDMDVNLTQKAHIMLLKILGMFKHLNLYIMAITSLQMLSFQVFIFFRFTATIHATKILWLNWKES